MTYVEKRKFFGGKNGIRYKSVIRYIDPPGDNGNAILTWNYEDKEKAFWFIRFRGTRRVAKRTTNTEFLRPSAEGDFSLTDYYDINVGEETHKLLRKEGLEGTACFVIKSTPIKQKLKYGKRISWIDPQSWIPLKIEYYDKKGKLWKILHVEWQNKFGLWFWKNAKIKNVQRGYKTTIIIEEVRVNLGLPDRDFTKVSLETKILGF
jgi:outer membrane lipoprotein-sorting protein